LSNEIKVVIGAGDYNKGDDWTTLGTYLCKVFLRMH